jgi:hypothetical protein
MPISRPPIEQSFFNTKLAVATTPTPLNTALDLNSLIQAFIICNPSFNANSVFFGDSNVTASSAGPTIGTGLEIAVGLSREFRIIQDRQLYELQDPEMLMAQQALCQSLTPNAIPIIVWKPNNIYLIAAVATTVSLCFFRNVYI